MHAARQPGSLPGLASRLHYERHRPEQTTLYRLVQQHAASFIAHTEASTDALFHTRNLDDKRLIEEDVAHNNMDFGAIRR